MKKRQAKKIIKSLDRVCYTRDQIRAAFRWFGRRVEKIEEGVAELEQLMNRHSNR